MGLGQARLALCKCQTEETTADYADYNGVCLPVVKMTVTVYFPISMVFCLALITNRDDNKVNKRHQLL